MDPKTRRMPDDEETAPVEDLPGFVKGLADPITRRPDGYYWQAPDGRQEFGPFGSYEEAWADMHAGDPDAPEPGETVQEAESEIGMADWIDPETGEPAEGQAPPHLDAD
jgi:hypothetical protein